MSTGSWQCYWINIPIRPFPHISDVGSAFTLSGGKETCKTCSVESSGIILRWFIPMWLVLSSNSIRLS